jgi:hypothetical protein
VRSDRTSRFRFVVAALLACGLIAAGAGSALAQAPVTGGSPTPGDPTVPVTPGDPAPVMGVATLAPDGSAIPPIDAPPRVRAAIAAANSIRTLPYVWGGGHAKFNDPRGYDCSGAVSFVLHAAKMIKTPMASGPMARSWGTPGVGKWITVYANGGHAYAVIAGLRWDTSAVGESLTSGSGPRWRATQRPSAGYAPKHFKNF